MLEKFTSQIISLRPVTQKTANQHERKIIPINSQEFRYLRFRAIGNMGMNGLNGNADGFPYEHFEDDTPGYGYKSFINKRAHVEHNSAEGMAGSIGDLPDAYLNRYIYPNELINQAGITVPKWSELLDPKYAGIRQKILTLPNQRDGAIEVLMRIDTKLAKTAVVKPQVRKLLDRLVRMIDTGQKIYCSMGTNVEYSHCAVCGNKARFSNEYCEHIGPNTFRKGMISSIPANITRDLLIAGILRPEWIPHLMSEYDAKEVLAGDSNRIISVRNGELNHVLSFFELSVVGSPAFEQADMLEKVARKNDETREEWLRKISSILGPENLIDLFEIAKNEELISSQCGIR